MRQPIVAVRVWLAAGIAALVTLPAVGAGLVASAPAAAAAAASTRASLGARLGVGVVSPPSGAAADLGPAPTTTRLDFDVALKPRDPKALADFATAVSTPGNALYRHFLAKGQVGRLFGPSPATVAAVRAALTEAGLRPGRVSPDGLIIHVTTTVGRAEAALHTRISAYRMASGRMAVADTVVPSLPASVASAVSSVIGLNTTTELHPATAAVPGPAAVQPNVTEVTAAASGSGPQPCLTARSTATQYTSYTADELAQAYSFGGLYSAGDLGAGATVALFELEPYKATDITTFQSCYTTSAGITNVTVDGGPGTGSGSGEAALDIETVIEMAPQAHVEVYQAPDTGLGAFDEYNKIETDDSASVVSTSWGLCEAFADGSMAAESAIFDDMTAQGQSIFASSGDTGSEDCLPNNGVDSASTGATPTALAVAPGSGTVYVADKGSDTVDLESEAEFGPSGTVPVGANPDGIAVDPNNDHVYVADDTNTGSVSVIPGATCNAVTQNNCAVTTIAGVGGNPVGVAVDPADGTVYVASAGSGTVSVISDASDTVVASVTLGPGTSPFGVAVDTSTHRVYVTDSGSDKVSMIDGTGCSALTQAGCGSTPPTVNVGTDPEGIAVDPATHTAYVANNLSSKVSVIDGPTQSVSATITTLVPHLPVGVALSPGGGEILVTGTESSAPAVAVIATDTNSVTTFLHTDAGPVAVAVDPTTATAFTADSTGGHGGTGDMAILPLSLAVDDPASQPDVTAVGGTDLTATSGPTETTWGDPLDASFDEPEGAGGGGASTVFAMPAYQTGVANPANSGSPCAAPLGCRQVPDVSAAADPLNGYVIFYKGSWTAFGGTSAATPLWAALLALTSVRNDTLQAQRMGNIDPDLYQLATPGNADFNDITTGDNDYTTTNDGDYPAGTGYDMATGLGTPRGSALAADLNPSPSSVAPVITADPVDLTVSPGQTASFTASATGTPMPTVQWFASTNGGTSFSTVTGATSTTLSFTASAAEDGVEYEAVFTNSVSSATTTAATLTVEAFGIATASLPGATRGVPYTFQLEATGGATPYKWKRTGGSLPKGLTLASTGWLSGTPKTKHVTPGLYSVTVRVTTEKSKGHPSQKASRTLTLTLS